VTKVLVTGYSGFVGQHLVRLIESQHELILLGRKPTGHGTFFKGDLSRKSSFGEALENVKIIIHCAGRVHVMDENPEESLAKFRETNTEGTINLASQAAKAGVKRFIFLSSIKVNGESTSKDNPFLYSDKPCPQDPYGLSKAEAEQQLLALGESTGMEIVIVRAPLVYGEGVKANFARLMRFVGKGMPLPFRAITDNKRSLVSVYNLADLLKTCIAAPSAANNIFLVSDDSDLSTAKMVALMAKVQHKRNLALPVPVWCFKLAGKIFGRTNTVDRLVGSLQLDIEHTKTTLDWLPSYTVVHGFKRAAIVDLL
jgi:UDP-glucose 4-epimerase